jgi:hypothetical protein
MFRFQLFLQRDLSLMKAAEPIDFVLILSSDLDLFAPSRDLILLRELLLSCELVVLSTPDMFVEGKLTYHATLHHEFRKVVIGLIEFEALRKLASGVETFDASDINFVVTTTTPFQQRIPHIISQF